MNDNQLRNGASALQHLVVDTIESILKLADNPGKCADYITSQIRELLGVRMIALLQCSEYPEKHQHSLLSVCPERRKAIAKNLEVEELAELSHNIHTVETWNPGGDSKKGGAILSAMGFADSIIAPLIVGENRVGVLLLLGLMDTHNIDSILESLKKLSGVIALVLRNSMLYQSLENKVEERTRELAASEERYHKLFEQASDGIFIADPQGNYVDVNSSGCNMLGYTREEILQLNIKDLVPEENQSREPLKLAELLAGEKILSERQLKCRDGKLVSVEISAKMLPDGRLQGIVRDITERKRAEEELQESEAKFRTLADTTAAAIIIFQETALLYVNPASCKITGYTEKQLLKMKFWEVIHPDFRELVKKRGLTRQKGKKVMKRYEVKIITAQGEERWVDFTASVIIFQNQPAVLGTAIDINERKRVEQALRASEVKFRSVVESSPMGMHMYHLESDDRLVFVGANNAADRILGMDNKQFIGKTIEEAFPPLAATEVPQRYRRAAAQGESWFTEQINYKDEKIAGAFEVHAFQTEPGKMVAMFLDITERKQAEEALQTNKKNLSTIYDTVGDVIFQLGVESADRFRFLSINRAFLEATGLTEEQIIGKRFDEVIPEPSQALVLGKYKEAIRDNKTVRWEETSVYPSGVKTGDVIVTPVVNENGICTHLIGSVHDITERKQAEAEIRKLNEALEQRVRERTAALEEVNKELEAFSYSVSHDLRTPLRGIDGFSQALLEDYHDQLDEQGKDYLQRVRAASQHMAQLIDDMLNLSRITRSEMKYVKVDLSAMAESIAHKLKETQPNRKVEFIIKPGLMVKGDTRLLRIVLDNLLGNAWKFTNKHPTARIEFGVTTGNGINAYFIKDDGAGFDMKFANKLFGPFQRLHGVSEFEGTGIGLATVQRIIHRHGGQIWGEGLVEKGATFYFTLTRERRSYEK